jgi:hypothetical protein
MAGSSPSPILASARHDTGVDMIARAQAHNLRRTVPSVDSAVKVSSVDVHAEYLDQLVDGRPVGASA